MNRISLFRTRIVIEDKVSTLCHYDIRLLNETTVETIVLLQKLNS